MSGAFRVVAWWIVLAFFALSSLLDFVRGLRGRRLLVL